MAKVPLNPIPSNKKVSEYGSKIRERINIEADETIKKIIGSGLLLTKELNQLLLHLFAYSEEIEKIISLLEKEEYPDIKFDIIEKEVIDEVLQKGYDKLRKTDETKAKSLFREVFRKYETEKKILTRKKMVSEIKDFSGAIEEEVSAFEDLQGVDLGLLPSIKLYICSNCHQIIQRFKFSKSTCGCGRSLEFTDTYSIFIVYINDNFKTFIDKNQWLEYGVEKLFQECGYNTECGVSLMGSSGTNQEIDVLGEKNKERVVVECKSGLVEPRDVLKFYSKMMDLGILKGFIFTTKLYKEIRNEVRRFSTSKNIYIIPSALDIKNEDIKKIIIETPNKKIKEIIGNIK